LEPGKPPKADKVAILSDATHLLGQLRAEAQKLQKSNESLQDSIKSLKVMSNIFYPADSPEDRKFSDEMAFNVTVQAEKTELRDEKARLKAERERLEQMVKGVSGAAAPAQFLPHPAAPPPFHPAAFAHAGKFVPYASYPPTAAFWQWIPPTSLDTSKDPAHWPPVA
jgi:hypothetical protein